MMRQGCSTSLFQAWQQWATMSSPERKVRFESQLSRMNLRIPMMSPGDSGAMSPTVPI